MGTGGEGGWGEEGAAACLSGATLARRILLSGTPRVISPRLFAEVDDGVLERL